MIIQATVPVPVFDQPVLLVGRENMNRAVHGDIVAVEIFKESEWKYEADEVIDREGNPLASVQYSSSNHVTPAALKEDDAEGDSDDEQEGGVLEHRRRVKEETKGFKKSGSKQPTGRVVGIIKRNWKA
jgi:exosome complex exonuclease DIS3/RRP44